MPMPMERLLSFFESNVTGMDVGSHSAKIVELRSNPRAVEVLRILEFPFDRNVSQDENLAELKAYLQREEVILENVVSALPGNRLTQRHLRFPFVGKQVSAAVPLALEEELPIPLDGMVLNQEQRARRQPKEQTDVLAVLAPMAEVAQHLEQIRAGGCDPSIVEIEGAVLANAIGYLGLDDQPRLVLDLGHRQTNVTLVSGGKPLMIRSIAVGGHHFTEALATELGLEPAAAEKQKFENGIFRPGSLTPLCARIGALLDQLARETLRSVQAIVSDAFDSESPAEILLVGGSALVPGLAQYLGERTRLSCRILSSFPEAPGLGPLATEPHPERFFQAFALALRGSSARRTSSNFRQGDFGYTADFSALGRELKRAAVLFAVVLGLWPLSHLADYWASSRRVSGIQSRVGALYLEAVPGAAVPGDPMATLQQRLSETEELANHLGVTGAGASPLELLRAIHERIPMELDISLEELRLERYSMKARGSAPDFNSVDRMREELSKIPIFRAVAVSNVGKVRRGQGTKFELSIELERQL